MGSRPIFRKALKFPIYPYFGRLDQIIISRLKKIKKNIKNSKIIFSALGLDIDGMLAHFLKRSKFPYQTLFLSA